MRWADPPLSEAAIETAFAQALAEETLRWIPITTMRPRDPARALANRLAARAAQAPATMDWSQPAANLAASEVTRIARAVFHAPDDAPVLFTAGGTESILLAMLAARAAHESGIRGSIVAGESAHPCLAKAAHLLGLRLATVPIDADGRTPPSALEAAIRPDTVALVASLPTDCHGVCDDAAEIGRVAERHGVWLHLDACLGGWLLPFMRHAGHDVPAPDFTCRARAASRRTCTNTATRRSASRHCCFAPPTLRPAHVSSGTTGQGQCMSPTGWPARAASIRWPAPGPAWPCWVPRE